MRVNKQWLFAAIIGGLLLWPNAVIAKTLNVPSTEYPTIRSAIDAAGDGDKVFVDDGTYTEIGLTWTGKHITVKSQKGPDNCIIDCEHNGTAFSFCATGQDATDIIEGFTIINGNAYEGGGIYCFNSSPTINNCILKDNTALFFGGGICCYNSSPAITNCVIGGEENGNYAGWAGGGIACFSTSALTITDCQIIGNEANDNAGGGIYCSEDSSLTISNCKIEANHALGESYPSYGGGIYVGYNQSIPTIITNCTIAGNSATAGAGLFCENSSSIITNCTIISNNNTGGVVTEGGGIYGYYSSLIIKNSILWDNYSAEYPQIFLELSSLEISYSDIEGGQDGIHSGWLSTVEWEAGNINEDPLFVDTENADYHLTEVSPCRDAGTNEGAPEDDIDGQKRPFKKIVDIGSDEYRPSQTNSKVNDVNFSLNEGIFEDDVEAINEADLPNTGKPEVPFPFGFFSFGVIDIDVGATIIVTLTLPENVPTDAQYWKYGPTPDNPTDHWYQFPFGSNDGDNIIMLTLTDGGEGDYDLAANGEIIDPGGIGMEVTDANGNGGNGGGGGCFIATACYGTPMAEEVKVLTRFRDECLLTNPVGQIFVNSYYKASPPLAGFISERPILKDIASKMLKPLIWLAKNL